MIYIFHFLILCFIVLGFLVYLLIRKFFTLHYWHTTWQNTINVEHIVREIINKACILSIITNRDSKLTDEDKENRIVENACAISADVLLQHNIEPKNYELPSLIKVEIYRIGRESK